MTARIGIGLTVCTLLGACKEPPPAAPRPPLDSPAPAPPSKQLRQIAAHQNQPRALLADDADVFWINQGGLEKYRPDVAPAGLMRVAAAGGTPVRLAAVARDAALAADADTLYFTDREAGTLSALARSGGAARAIARGLDHPTALAVDAAAVYVLTAGAVTRVARRGGAPVAIVEHLPPSSGVALDGDRLFVRASFGGQLLAAPKSGGAATLVVEEPKQWATWLADRGAVFWTTMDADPVVRALLDGHTQTLARPAQLPWRLAADATHVYFSDGASLVRVPRTGGATQAIAPFPSQVTDVVLTPTTIYFSDLLTINALSR